MAYEVDYSDLANHVGKEVGVSDWVTITQERVNQFAEATGDHQWIHVDVERANREMGGPIAHGYLTLFANTTLSYHLFSPYEGQLQRGFRFDDPEIGIEWPSPPKIIGERDKGLPYFSKIEPEFKSISS